MSIPKDIEDMNKGLGPWSILSAYRGSIAHGMYIPQEDPNSIDDKDAISVCVPSEDYYLGLKEYGSRGTKEIKKGEWDIVIFEVKKFISMLKNGNPNVLTTLWLEPQHYIKRTEAGKLIIASRELFVGRHVYRSFSGYAYAQLHQMTKKSYSGYMGDISTSISKLKEIVTGNAIKLLADPEFLSLISKEWLSSISKTAMINRVQKFIPKIRPEYFPERGTAGIRTPLITPEGKFLPDVLELTTASSFHIINYNSPGATGAPAYSAFVVKKMQDQGLLDFTKNPKRSIWNFDNVLNQA
ncbi:MAG: nucleotidyltransferase domain-containing protein [Thaumarchaeota archaeon]|nr:nucleotidyltransferase domain-containing protein [Nitrososphaerota archaeon]